MAFHSPSPTMTPLVDDYPSDDDKDAPPPSPSCPATPPQEINLFDAASVNDYRPCSRDHATDDRRIHLPPISRTPVKDKDVVTLPPLHDLIADACRDCEQERSRRATWDYEHSRLHPRHMYAGQHDISGLAASAHERPHAISLDVRRHTLAGPMAVHSPYDYPHSPHFSRPRYASQVPDSRSPAEGVFVSQYVDQDCGGCAHAASDINFAGYSLSSRPRSHPCHPEPAIDPHDASYTQLRQAFDDRRLPQPQSWRRTHVDTAFTRGRNHPAAHRSPEHDAFLSSPDFSLSRSRTPSLVVSSQRKQSFSHQPYPPPHTRRGSSTQPKRRNSALPRAHPVGPSSLREGDLSVDVIHLKQEAPESSMDFGVSAPPSPDDTSRPRSAGAPGRAPAEPLLPPKQPLQPFTDEQITALADKFLLALHPKRTQIRCRWEGGCGRSVHEPLTANIVAHLQQYHGVCAKERSNELVACRWGGGCARTLKACSIRNHILNCHEKAKTGECRLCHGLISRAETYLMARHLSSCLNKIAREGDLEARLREAGVIVNRDIATGEVWFSSLPGVDDDCYEELDRER